jgi:hypothetical protein
MAVPNFTEKEIQHHRDEMADMDLAERAAYESDLRERFEDPAMADQFIRRIREEG